MVQSGLHAKFQEDFQPRTFKNDSDVPCSRDIVKKTRTSGRKNSDFENVACDFERMSKHNELPDVDWQRTEGEKSLSA